MLKHKAGAREEASKAKLSWLLDVVKYLRQKRWGKRQSTEPSTSVVNQSSAYDLISRHAVALMHSGQLI